MNVTFSPLTYHQIQPLPWPMKATAAGDVGVTPNYNVLVINVT